MSESDEVAAAVEAGAERVDNGMEFDITPIVVPVKIRDKDGTLREYELHEASGDIACKWRNGIIAKARMGPDGKPQSFGAIADSEPALVAMCLRPKGEDKNVSVQLVRSWPSRIQKALFEKAKEISDLDEDETILGDSAKNEQEDTTDG